MAFYDLPKKERDQLVVQINERILYTIRNQNLDCLYQTAYLAIGKIFCQNIDLQKYLIHILKVLLQDKSFYIRQWVK